jgi:hypothetical protein
MTLEWLKLFGPTGGSPFSMVLLAVVFVYVRVSIGFG